MNLHRPELRGTTPACEVRAETEGPEPSTASVGKGEESDGRASFLNAEFASMDAVVALSNVAIEKAKRPGRACAGEKPRWSTIPIRGRPPRAMALRAVSPVWRPPPSARPATPPRRISHPFNLGLKSISARPAPASRSRDKAAGDRPGPDRGREAGPEGA